MKRSKVTDDAALKKAGNTYICGTHVMRDMKYRVNRGWVLTQRHCKPIDFTENEACLFNFIRHALKGIMGNNCE